MSFSFRAGRPSCKTIAVLFACLFGAARAAPPTPPPGGATGAPASCPSRESLRERLRVLWQLTAADRLEIDGCIPGRFPDPGFLVTAIVDHDGRPSLERWAALSPAGLRAERAPVTIAPWLRGEGGGGAGKLQLVDLDGDGSDEIIEESFVSHGGSTVAALSVLRVDGAAIKQLIELTTDYDNSAAAEDPEHAVHCSAKVEVLPRTAGGTRALAVTGAAGKLSRREREAGCIAGKRVFDLKQGRLVERKPVAGRGRAR